jgi:uncharacterized protein (UPF0276 family)
MMPPNPLNLEGALAPSSFTHNHCVTNPIKSGVSLKSHYYQTILKHQPDVGFFEIHAENYLSLGGPALHYLEKIAQLYPITIHGVGMSIGGSDAINKDHLNRVHQLVNRIEPIYFSEHLAWSSHSGAFLNDLLPLPYNANTLQRVCDHIDLVQNTLKRTILIENPSTYLEFNDNQYSEIEFIQLMSQRSGCKLLLDINNVEVSCFNHRQDPIEYLNQFPIKQVNQLHLAGHALDTHSATPLKVDSHDREISPEVWELYQQLLKQAGDKLTLIEWDGNLPSFETLHQQAQHADKLRSSLCWSHHHVQSI